MAFIAACQDLDKLNPLASSLVELLILDQEVMTATPSGTELGKINKSGENPGVRSSPSALLVFFKNNKKEVSVLVLPATYQFSESLA